MDDATKRLTAGERGDTAIISAQRHTSRTDPVTRPARPGRLARSALLLLVAVAVAAPAWSQTPTTLIKNTGQREDTERPAISVAYAQEFSTGAYPDGYTLTTIAILLTGVAPNSAMRASVWTTSMSGLPDVKQFGMSKRRFPRHLFSANCR